MKCLIVDDEPLSLDVLEKYIRDVPELVLVARCNDAIEAMGVLKEQQVDIVFLDINMPKLSGINMVKTIRDLPFVVFTTAYPEYAVEGFELDVLDYLVKPISFERFMKAVLKAQAKSTVGSKSIPIEDNQFLMIKTNKKLVKVLYSKIQYIQSMGDFVKIVTAEKTYISSDTLKQLITQLPQKQFVRIHKSYIISINAFKFLEGNRVMVGEEYLPVGLTYKENLLTALDVRNED